VIFIHVLGAVLVVRHLQENRRQTIWIPVTAGVRRAEVEVWQSRTTFTYAIRTSAYYWVDGQAFEYPGVIVCGNPSVISREEVDRLAAQQLDSGNSLLLLYNPRNPREATSDTRTQGRIPAALLFYTFFIYAPVLIVCMFVTNW